MHKTRRPDWTSQDEEYVIVSHRDPKSEIGMKSELGRAILKTKIKCSTNCRPSCLLVNQNTKRCTDATALHYCRAFSPLGKQFEHPPRRSRFPDGQGRNAALTAVRIPHVRLRSGHGESTSSSLLNTQLSDGLWNHSVPVFGFE